MRREVIVEEKRKGQEPDIELSEQVAPSPTTPSVAPYEGPQTDHERAWIKDGQAKAVKDEAEMRSHGFGGHIGTE
jgi:hypothetical protein